jgi:hypothetical protein
MNHKQMDSYETNQEQQEQMGQQQYQTLAQDLSNMHEEEVEDHTVQ